MRQVLLSARGLLPVEDPQQRFASGKLKDPKRLAATFFEWLDSPAQKAAQRLYLTHEKRAKDAGLPVPDRSGNGSAPRTTF